MKLEKTIVIAAMYCCGKTYLSQHSDYSVLDLDGEFKQKREQRVAGVEKEFMNKLKESIGKYDIILVYPSVGLLSDLYRMGIPYVLVYPKNSKPCEKEWERRNIARGTSTMWDTLKPYHRNKVRSLSLNKKAHKKFELNKDQYLSDIIDDIVKS